MLHSVFLQFILIYLYLRSYCESKDLSGWIAENFSAHTCSLVFTKMNFLLNFIFVGNEMINGSHVICSINACALCRGLKISFPDTNRNTPEIQ
ncbi:uncharacterized protein V2V93DRAFT_365934 [Kockiozyma suomiensis]|uniref:uncharacterized protein n=1 Tax=Kockiozyma suomiensis TaxID=1337062 RepID=UPI0033438A0A